MSFAAYDYRKSWDDILRQMRSMPEITPKQARRFAAKLRADIRKAERQSRAELVRVALPCCGATAVAMAR